MGKMSEQEMQGFLDESRIGRMVALQSDGSQHTASIWYKYRNRVFIAWTDCVTRRFKNISADPRVTMSVASGGRP
jgi:hypothetical protein